MSRTSSATPETEHSRDGEGAGSLVELRHGSGPRRGEIQRFEREFVRLGRGPDNDVAFDLFDVPCVSARHAGIRREGEGFVLYDMGSLNGTLLNGMPVQRTEIAVGDEIALGRTGPTLEVLRLRIAGPLAAAGHEGSTPSIEEAPTPPSGPSMRRIPRTARESLVPEALPEPPRRALGLSAPVLVALVLGLATIVQIVRLALLLQE